MMIYTTQGEIGVKINHSLSFFCYKHAVTIIIGVTVFDIHLAKHANCPSHVQGCPTARHRQNLTDDI